MVVGDDSLLRVMEHPFADLMHAPERCDAYQVFVSGMPPRDYQASYSPLTAICNMWAPVIQPGAA